MKIYINDRITEAYGFGVIIVCAENIEEADYLALVHTANNCWRDNRLFEKEAWREFEGVVPSYLQTKGKVLYYHSYIE